ncbi:MAG: adenosylmethionine--8-amino-7-oxononanoate transaminase [Bacteroidia bacterium]
MGISERDKKVIWHPFTQAATAPEEKAIVKAEGVWLFDEEGNKILDATSSWWVNAHGHSNPYIAQKIFEQASRLEHIIFAGFTHEPAVELAERVIKLINGNQSRIFYSDNGSTSVEVAIKMTLQYFFNKGEKKKKFIAFKNAYHGDTFGAMSVAERNAFSAPFADLLFDVEFIQAPENGSRFPLEELKGKLTKNDVAGFIFEPLVQGANGMRMHDAEVLSEMIGICREHQVISIADEVFTGFYRTGNVFASNYLKEKPDLICLSKTLTGGTLPLGITAAPEFIYEAFLSEDKYKTFFHGHSFTANPISCAAALASLDLMADENFKSKIEFISQSHDAFVDTIRDSSVIFEIRKLGTILAIELKTENERGYMNPVSAEITKWFLERNIYLRPLGNVIYVTPPYIITKEELEIIYDSIIEFLKEMNSHIVEF